jgi:hypothetical protein
VVPLGDATWIHILGEDLLAGGGRTVWRAAGILAGVHVWLGTLLDTEERVDRNAIWSAFMVTVSLLVAIATLQPLAGFPDSLSPRLELLLAFTAVLVGLLRTGLDLRRALDPPARQLESLHRQPIRTTVLRRSDQPTRP